MCHRHGTGHTVSGIEEETLLPSSLVVPKLLLLLVVLFSLGQWFSAEPAASALPGNLLEMPTPGPAATCVSVSPPEDADSQSSLRTSGLVYKLPESRDLDCFVDHLFSAPGTVPGWW